MYVKNHACVSFFDLMSQQYFELRCRTVDSMAASGVTAYPHKFAVSMSAPHFVASHSELSASAELRAVRICLSGRISNIRKSSSKLIFVDVSADGADFQVVANLREFEDAGEFARVTGVLRRGDIVGARGFPGKTKAGVYCVLCNRTPFSQPINKLNQSKAKTPNEKQSIPRISMWILLFYAIAHLRLLIGRQTTNI